MQASASIVSPLMSGGPGFCHGVVGTQQVHRLGDLIIGQRAAQQIQQACVLVALFALHHERGQRRYALLQVCARVLPESLVSLVRSTRSSAS